MLKRISIQFIINVSIPFLAGSTEKKNCENSIHFTSFILLLFLALFYVFFLYFFFIFLCVAIIIFCFMVTYVCVCTFIYLSMYLFVLFCQVFNTGSYAKFIRHQIFLVLYFLSVCLFVGLFVRGFLVSFFFFRVFSL